MKTDHIKSLFACCEQDTRASQLSRLSIVNSCITATYQQTHRKKVFTFFFT